MGKKTIIIAGSGVFGTAIAERLAWNTDNQVLIYARNSDVVEEINTNHKNSKSFSTRYINKNIKAFNNLETFSKASYIFLAIPSKAILSFCNQIKEHVKDNTLIINLAKGMSDEGAFITEKLPFKRKASMKGPTFAIELLNGFPSAFTFGGNKEDYLIVKDSILKNTALTLDYTNDIRAVELLSILKNMYAIAIGLVSGRYNSPNVDFLIYTKSVNEMRKFLTLFECESSTIFTYCGMGDLGLTSLNDLSRNRTLGLLVGKGFLQDNKSTTVIEGYRTIKLMYEKTKEHNLVDEYPIVTALYKLMYKEESLTDYINTVFK
ncbi:MAG: glycerol-3-phosphate dehydrogenase [Spirochaetia bacterium]|nr:glycerol-3-phosphate dehydrogenase [Spirochaetia bacterium]